jgi:hypothetical protein
MQVSEKSDEVYKELAKQIEANDGAAARGIFQELLNNGFSRQEIVARVSRLIEKRSAGKPGGTPTDKIGWLRPHRLVEPSVSDARKRPNASGRASMPNARHVDNSADKSSPSSGISSDRFTLSVPERLAAKLQLQKDLKLAQANQGMPAEIEAQVTGLPEGEAQNILPAEAPRIMPAELEAQRTVPSKAEAQRIVPEDGEAQLIEPREAEAQRIAPADLEAHQTELAKIKTQQAAAAELEAQQAPATEVQVEDRPSPNQHGSPASSRRLRTVATGTSAIAAALAGLFVLWRLYGNELEEVSAANAKHVLTWLQEFGGNRVSFSPLPATPPKGTGKPEQTTAENRSNEFAKRAEAQPPTPLNMPQREASVTAPAASDAQAQPDTSIASTPADAASPSDPPGSPTSEQALSPGSPPLPSQQNGTEVTQRPQTAGPQLASADTGALVAQGDELLSKSDVASARPFYQRAAEAGDGRGALRMGMTFDSVFLARWRIRNVPADRTLATYWYRYASGLGNTEAGLMKKKLNPQDVAPRGQRTTHGPRRAPATQHAKRG